MKPEKTDTRLPKRVRIKVANLDTLMERAARWMTGDEKSDQLEYRGELHAGFDL
jgi:hypothetical protein